ncbi:MAG: ABC transporter substrate-binding protein [Bdellovibrionales bacterium]|nr:ABC transporter substrate-binding protein [Bdellovibrionales bacterium]
MNQLKIYLFPAIIFLILCHCKPNPIPSDTLTVALDSEPKTLDPRKATDANGMRLAGLLFHGLVKIGPDLKIQPDGAKSWIQKNRTYTFFLKDLTFSNGRPVTRDDLLFTFDEFQKTSSPFHSAFKNIESIHVEREKGILKLQISLKKFSAVFLSADLPIIKILPKKEALKKDFHKNPIGTGIFKLKKKTSRKIVLERRFPSEPNLPKYISFLIIRDAITRVQKILAGEVDIAPSVVSPEKTFLFSEKDFQILSAQGLSTAYLLLNLKNPYLKNKEVRKALSQAIHREEIIQYKLKGYGLLAVSLISPQNFFFNKTLANPPFDPEKARQIIQKHKLENITLSLACSNNQNSRDKATVLVSQLNKTGLKISLGTAEWGTFYEDLSRGQFDMAFLKWVGVTDPDIYNLAFHSKNQAPKGRNRSFYDNRILDELLEKGLREKNPWERKKIYDKVQSLINEDIAIIPLWHNKEISITKKGIKNYVLPANGDFSTLHKVIKPLH